MKKIDQFTATGFYNHISHRYSSIPVQNDFESLASVTVDTLNTIVYDTSNNTNTIETFLSTIQQQQKEIESLIVSVNQALTWN